MDKENRHLGVAARYLAATLLCSFMSPSAHAEIIYKSADLGPVDQSGGHEVNSSVFFASRFKITTDTEVTRIGGHMRCNTGCGEQGAIFGAIVKVSPQTGSPVFKPSEISAPGNVIAYTKLTPPPLSKDVRAILEVTLPPGEYALVFGSGAFGTSGTASLPDNNPVVTGTLFFQGNVEANTWTPVGELPNRWRFVVDGEPLSRWQVLLRGGALPGIVVLILVTAAIVWALRRRRQRREAE